MRAKLLSNKSIEHELNALWFDLSATYTESQANIPGSDSKGNDSSTGFIHTPG